MLKLPLAMISFDEKQVSAQLPEKDINPIKQSTQLIKEMVKGEVRSTNVVYQPWEVSRKQREKQNGHRSGVIWLTGLPASGKTTIAEALGKELLKRKYQVSALDGDRMRMGLCKDLGFSQQDRMENIRRVAEVAKLFYEIGQIVICSFVTPFQEERNYVRSLMDDGGFFEIYLRCSLEICKKRDPKGHYEKALVGEIKEFTGISSPFEIPTDADLILDSGEYSVNVLSQRLITFLENKKLIPGRNRSSLLS